MNDLEDEVRHRRRLSKVYNCIRSDFDTLEEYNDFLEKIESLIDDLMFPATEAKANEEIERYKRDNAAQIASNNARNDEAIRVEKSLLLSEKQSEASRLENEAKLLREREIAAEIAAKNEKTAFLDKLKRSERPSLIARPATVAQRKEQIHLEFSQQRANHPSSSSSRNNTHGSGNNASHVTLKSSFNNGGNPLAGVVRARESFMPMGLQFGAPLSVPCGSTANYAMFPPPDAIIDPNGININGLVNNNNVESNSNNNDGNVNKTKVSEAEAGGFNRNDVFRRCIQEARETMFLKMVK